MRWKKEDKINEKRMYKRWRSAWLNSNKLLIYFIYNYIYVYIHLIKRFAENPIETEKLPQELLERRVIWYINIEKVSIK